MTSMRTANGASSVISCIFTFDKSEQMPSAWVEITLQMSQDVPSTNTVMMFAVASNETVAQTRLEKTTLHLAILNPC